MLDKEQTFFIFWMSRLPDGSVSMFGQPYRHNPNGHQAGKEHRALVIARQADPAAQLSFPIHATTAVYCSDCIPNVHGYRAETPLIFFLILGGLPTSACAVFMFGMGHSIRMCRDTCSGLWEVMHQGSGVVAYLRLCKTPVGLQGNLSLNHVYQWLSRI